jgi:hypothetical protein
MKKHMFLTLVLVAVFSLVIVSPLRADDDIACSNASLRGSFGLGGGPNVAVGFGPTASLGSITSDGAGSLEGKLTQSFDGIIVHEVFTGAYTVNSDCTGTATFVLQPGGRAAHLGFVLLGEGDQIFMIETDATTVATFVLEKQLPKACSNVHLKGAYGFTQTGSIVGVGPVSNSGLMTIDENGNVTGSQTKSVNGHISQESFSGTYTIQSDCTGSATLISKTDGSTTSFEFVAVGGNTLRGLQTNPHTIVVTLAKRLGDD